MVQKSEHQIHSLLFAAATKQHGDVVKDVQRTLQVCYLSRMFRYPVSECPLWLLLYRSV